MNGGDKRAAVKHRVAEIGKMHKVKIVFYKSVIKTALLGECMPLGTDFTFDKLLTVQFDLRSVFLHHVNIKSHVLRGKTLQLIEKIIKINSHSCLKIQPCVNADFFHIRQSSFPRRRESNNWIPDPRIVVRGRLRPG